MISHCANPDCVARFDGRGGRFFRFRRKHSPNDASPNSHSVEHFWLCKRCSEIYTLKDLGDKVTVHLRPSITELESVT
jgi:hypothetical protein